MKLDIIPRQTKLAGISTVVMIIALLGQTPSALAQVACIAGLQFNACSVDQGATIAGFVRTVGDGSTIDNAGTINSGIITSSVNSGITNTGTIGGIISTNASNSSITNSGNVGDFILATGTNLNITNSGHVGSDIIVSGTKIKVTNSGTIVGGITMSTVDSSLTLLPGSRIFWFITIVGTGTRTLNVGDGLNLMATFLTPPIVINTNGQPFVLSGNQVAVLDPTALSLQDEMLVDLTGGIFSGLHARLAEIASDPDSAASGFAGLAQMDFPPVSLHMPVVFPP